MDVQKVQMGAHTEPSPGIDSRRSSKASKIRSCSSAGMPMPVSLTLTTICSSPVTAETSTDPDSVNLTALDCLADEIVQDLR